MGVLEKHQDGAVPREAFNQMEQCIKPHLAFALRAKVEFGGRRRQ